MSRLDDLEARLSHLVELLHRSHYLVVFTGAGISTDSGLPDFRGPDGLWIRRDKGLPPQESKPWDSVEPNACHAAIAELQEMGKMKFLISQNVDNLHLKSGVRTELLAELHGNLTKLRCTRCGETTAKSEGKTLCPCGGKLVDSIVHFGQSLPERDLSLAYEHSQRSDLFLVVGSSLVVTPAADMPVEALRAGAHLVIVNSGETPFDHHCAVRFHERIGDVLPEAVKRLKALMGAKG